MVAELLILRYLAQGPTKALSRAEVPSKAQASTHAHPLTSALSGATPLTQKQSDTLNGAFEHSNIHSLTTTHFSSFVALVSFLFSKGNAERDTSNATVIVLDHQATTASALDALPIEDKKLLLRYFFNHLNVVVVLSTEAQTNIKEINTLTAKISSSVGERIVRVETWTGTGFNSLDDTFEEERSDYLPTMSAVLLGNTNKSYNTRMKVIQLHKILMEEIDFESLLAESGKSHLAKLCLLVGHWSFPAHELSNDDLVYCVYLMIEYALKQVKEHEQTSTEATLLFPSKNELLGLVFMVRDTYKNGNPFHNFRHATDVLQATFHYLVRLGCLPVPKQLQMDPNACEMEILESIKKDDDGLYETEFVAIKTPHDHDHDQDQTHLNPLQTFGLLIAALGHDVGHPGVTNAFMTKYCSPTSLIYNGQSVLELYHSSVFINKILCINWPTLLSIHTDPSSTSSPTMRQFIISCILATDMAEHFEYIGKISQFQKHLDSSLKEKTAQLISNLLIKCADISNVTRPLRVSAQWALVLSREFEEVATLERKLTTRDSSMVLEPQYAKLPKALEDTVASLPDIYKGQIFFINTFAENLFQNVAELLPELKYTCEIILSNKEYWFGCKDS